MPATLAGAVPRVRAVGCAGENKLIIVGACHATGGATAAARNKWFSAGYQTLKPAASLLEVRDRSSSRRIVRQPSHRGSRARTRGQAGAVVTAAEVAAPTTGAFKRGFQSGCGLR